MASRFLTDAIGRLRRSLAPTQILTARIRNGQILLSACSPARNAPLFAEQDLAFAEEGTGSSPPLPDSEEARSHLPLVLFWPSERTVSSSLRLPPSVTASEREAAIGALIELTLPWPIDESLLAWESDPADPTSLTAWAISRTELSSWLDRLREKGLVPRWVLPESLLVLERFHPGGREADRPSLAPLPTSGVIDEEGDRTLLLLSRNGRLLGESAFRQPRPSPELRDRRIADLLLGLLAAGHELPERFLRSPGILPTPALSGITHPEPGHPGELSLSGWSLIARRTREEAAALSFLKGSLSWQGDRAERRSGLRVLAFLSLLLAATLAVDASVHLSRVDHRLEAARAALDLAASRALPGHRIVEPLGQLTQELASLDRQKKLLSGGPDVIRIMRDLTTSPPSGISYEMVSLTVTRRFFTVNGKTDSFRSVDALKKAFEATGHMRDLSIQSAGLDIDRKTVTFRMRGRHD